MAKSNVLTYDDMTGAQRAAVLLVTLGREAATEIMKRLSPSEVDELAVEMHRLDAVDPSVQSRILKDYSDQVMGSVWLTEFGPDYTRDLLAEAFGTDDAEAILKRLSKSIEDTGLNRLKKADPEHLRTILRAEHPQTIALILSHLSPKQTAEVIGGLDAEFASDILFRMARMEKVSPDMLELLETQLGGQANLQFSRGMSVAGGPQAVAEVLNLTPGSAEKALMEALSKRSAPLADEIKNLMFVFDDIMLLDARSMTKVIGKVETKMIALALKRAHPDLRAKFTSAMSQRQADALADEAEMMGAIRTSDMEKAQAEIVRIIRELEDEGEIIISGGSGDDAIIE